MSSGAWVRTAADAVTALSAAGGAIIGGVWAYFRYRRQAPDVPRVNATVSAMLFREAEHDYLAIDVELRHLAGGVLNILRGADYDPSTPVVEIAGLVGGPAGRVESVPITSIDVLRDQAELGSSEATTDHKIVPVGARRDGTIAYEAQLRLAAGWKAESWTWCTNAIVRVSGPEKAIGATIVGSPPA